MRFISNGALEEGGGLGQPFINWEATFVLHFDPFKLKLISIF